MRFDEQLRQYMDEIGCTNRELADAGGLGERTISRYRTGERTPDEGSSQLSGLCRGLASLSAAKGLPYTEEEILQKLKTTVSDDLSIEYEAFLTNLKTLLQILGIKNVDLARYLHNDPSLISRILSGKLKPANRKKFIFEVASYIAKYDSDEQHLPELASLYGCSPEDLSKNQALIERTIQWLGSNTEGEDLHQIQSFLEKLDQFDLNEFMRSIRFEEIKVPTVPFQLPTTKMYYGIREMMEAELDFLKSAVLSRSKQDVILYSDMPMEEMSKDPNFPKKWMFGMAMLLRKGLHLHNIHDVHRPLPDMLLGLEGWIPMYMTGQISPYYLKEPTNHTFLHFIRSAGSVAISGEAIYGKHVNGRYLVTRSKEDVAYYRRRAEDLLKRSLPLMHIYRKEQEADFHIQMKELLKKTGSYRLICNAPPLFTMSEGLLQRILKRCAVPENEKNRILKYHVHTRGMIGTLFGGNNTWSLELPEMTMDNWDESPVRVPLAEIFPETEIQYTAQEYQEHLTETRTFVSEHACASILINPYAAFRNIEILICAGQYVHVAKSNPPARHFIIYHPKMIDAFHKFVPPIIE